MLWYMQLNRWINYTALRPCLNSKGSSTSWCSPSFSCYLPLTTWSLGFQHVLCRLLCLSISLSVFSKIPCDRVLFLVSQCLWFIFSVYAEYVLHFTLIVILKVWWISNWIILGTGLGPAVIFCCHANLTLPGGPIPWRLSEAVSLYCCWKNRLVLYFLCF